jgi:hypothetical protein
MRRAAAVLLAAGALVVTLTGCASTGVTAGRLSQSVAPTFEHLYRWKQQLEGESTSKTLDTSATCHRANPSDPDEGAGSEWLCTMRFLIDGPNTQVSFNWNVSAKPDGCWNADGVPAQLGGQTVLTNQDKRVIDPIYNVTGCFPAT